MSSRSDRRSAPRAWHPNRTVEILDLIERNRAIAECMAECARVRGGHAELEAAKYKFWARALELLHPYAGQRADTPLADVVITKRSNQPMQIYGRVSEIIREKWGTRIRLALNSAGVSPKLLKADFAKVGRIQLRQMQNAALRAAGFVFEPTITKTGEIDLWATITDPLAAQKIASRVYTGAVVSFDGDEISDISLIDSPVSFMQKGSTIIICKVYESEPGMRKSDGVPLPASAAAVFAEIDRTEAVLKSGVCGDRMAATAQNQRARQQIGVEFIRALRANPSNQLGGPRYQL